MVLRDLAIPDWFDQQHKRRRLACTTLPTCLRGQTQQLLDEGLSLERIGIRGETIHRLASRVHDELFIIPRHVKAKVVALGLVLGDGEWLDGTGAVDDGLVEDWEGARWQADFVVEVRFLTSRRAGRLRAELVARECDDLEP